MKRVVILVLAILCFSLQAQAQADPGDCIPSVTDPSDPDYCVPIPIDENIAVLVFAGIGIGLWKIRSKGYTNV